jgi:hypothetical protein
MSVGSDERLQFARGLNFDMIARAPTRAIQGRYDGCALFEWIQVVLVRRLK